MNFWNHWTNNELGIASARSACVSKNKATIFARRKFGLFFVIHCGRWLSHSQKYPHIQVLQQMPETRMKRTEHYEFWWLQENSQDALDQNSYRNWWTRKTLKHKECATNFTKWKLHIHEIIIDLMKIMLVLVVFDATELFVVLSLPNLANEWWEKMMMAMKNKISSR